MNSVDEESRPVSVATESERAGCAAGVEWARANATPGQLRDLEANEGNGASWYIGTTGIDSGWTEFQVAARKIDAASRETIEAANAFWSEAVGDDGYGQFQDNLDYLRGFLEGALEVWQEIKAKL